MPEAVSESFADNLSKKLFSMTIMHYDLDFADIFIEADKTEYGGDEKRIDTSEKLLPREESEQAAYDMYDRIQSIGRRFSRGMESALFCTQGGILKDFTDCSKRKAPADYAVPTYAMLTFEQFRTYFTWRAAVRKGKVRKIDRAYVLLYIFEIINKIGIEDPYDGLNKLLWVWKNYGKDDPTLNTKMKNWFKGYYVVNAFKVVFSEYVEKDAFLKNIYGVSEKPDYFEVYSPVSSYAFSKSGFIDQDNLKALHDCFNYLVDRINERHNSFFYFCSATFVGEQCSIWQPYENAIYNNFNLRTSPLPRSRRIEVRVSYSESYIYDGIVWKKCDHANMYGGVSALVGYIIKLIESRMRRLQGYKELKTGNPKYNEDRVNRFLGENELIEIKRDIDSYFTLTNEESIVVNVDPEKIQAIRINALETQERLLAGADISEMPEKTDVNAGECEAAENTKASDGAKTAADTEAASDGAENMWSIFASSLTDIERGALLILLDGGGIADFTKYAKDMELMPEILADSINEKAADIIGDSILELSDRAEIYEDYTDFLKGAVKRETE